MDNETKDVLAPGFLTALDSTLSWLSQSPLPFNLSTISVLILQSLQHFLVLTKSQNRDVRALIPQILATVQRSFSQLAVSVPKPIVVIVQNLF